MRFSFALCLICLLSLVTCIAAQTPSTPREPSRADILRGAYSQWRANNDLLSYDLDLRVDPDKKFLSGKNTIRFKMLKDDTRIQLDLFANLNVDKILHGKTELKYTRELGTVYVDFPAALRKGSLQTIEFYYSGTPQETGRFGGISFRKDPAGRHWITTACEGIGASIWWPNKDQQRDEAGFDGHLLAQPTRTDDEAAECQARNGHGHGDREQRGKREVDPREEPIPAQKRKSESGGEVIQRDEGESAEAPEHEGVREPRQGTLNDDLGLKQNFGSEIPDAAADRVEFVPGFGFSGAHPAEDWEQSRGKQSRGGDQDNCEQDLLNNREMQHKGGFGEPGG